MEHACAAEHASFVERLEPPDRDEWQKPEEVLDRLGLEAGARICEIGPGIGISLEAFRAIARRAALRETASHTLLPWHYFVELEP